MVISHPQAVEFFEKDQVSLLALVNGKPLLAGAAYVSFGYNVGRGALVNVLNGSDSISNQRHTTDRHGVVLDGLVSRRLLEQMLIEIAG